MIENEDVFPDNWIYIHDPSVKVGRIQNFRSWSPYMVPNDKDASIGMEYFCFEGDELWRMSDDKLVTMATREIQKLGLARADKVKMGFVVRVHKAYPMYDAEYAERVETIRGWLDRIPNLTQVGRNGLHRYNNSDHSMLTAMRAVDNILTGSHHDIWAVNAESVYHEEDHENENPTARPRRRRWSNRSRRADPCEPGGFFGAGGGCGWRWRVLRAGGRGRRRSPRWRLAVRGPAGGGQCQTSTRCRGG